ncbi:MAG TPA: hypothetical protein VGL15_02310 [Vicinamibacteria bacterium]|jgi:hypothetical protein
MSRERKRAPHLCGACGSRFEVCYFDDRQDDMQEPTGSLIEVHCPHCGKPKTVSVPRGAERTVLIEPVDEDAEADEGGGG